MMSTRANAFRHGGWMKRAFLVVLVTATIARGGRSQEPPSDPPPDDDAPIIDDSKVSTPPPPPPSAWEPANWDPIDDTPFDANSPRAPGGPKLPETAAPGSNQAPNASDPVLGSGEFVHTTTDLSFAGFGIPFQFTRTYRSQVSYQGPLGYGWTHNFNRRIVDHSPDGTPDCAGAVYYVSDRLERIKFTPVAVSGTVLQNHVAYTAGPDVALQLEHYLNAADPWLLRDGSGLVYLFDANGGLHRIQDPAGNALVVTWDYTVPTDDGGIVTKVTDTTGRAIYFHHQVYRIEFHAWARLECLSLADNCKSPLVSFQMSSTGEHGEEFDLVRVLDADGKGPFYSYNTESRSSSYAADSDLQSICHEYCDSQGNDPQTCHNFDACSWVENAALSARCDFDQPPLETFVDKNQTPNFETTTGIPIFVMNAIPMGYQGTGASVSLDWDSRVVPQQFPGFGFCVDQCIGHYDVNNPNAATDHPCYSDVFPLCVDLSHQRAVPVGYTMSDDEWFEWREGCGCAMASDYQFCRSSPTDVSVIDCPKWLASLDADLKACRASPTDTSNVNCPQWLKWLGIAGVTDLDPNMVSKYATDCRATYHAKFDASAPACHSTCLSICLNDLSAKDASGVRRYAFGRIEQLNHNLVEIDAGDGRLILRNTYGTDPFDAAFDRVLSQQLTDSMPDNVIAFDYHDLTLEQSVIDGTLKPTHDPTSLAIGINYTFSSSSNPTTKEGYTLHLDPAHVKPISSFSSVDVCPSTCSKAVLPPVGIDKDGLIPLGPLNPADRVALIDSAPIYLQQRVGGSVEVIATGKRNTKPRDAVFLRLLSARGEVSLLRTRVPTQFTIIGTQTAIDHAFDKNGQLIARLGLGARDFVTPLRSTIAQPRVLSPPPKVTRLPSSLSEQSPSGDSKNTKTPETTALVANSRGTSAQKGPARSYSLFTSLFAQGFATGSAPVTITRTGARSAEIIANIPPGATVRIALGKAYVTLTATSRPNVFKIAGATKGIFDRSGRARVWSTSTGDIKIVPADQAANAAKQILQLTGKQQGAVNWSGQKPATQCVQAAFEEAKTLPGVASTPQLPRYAVVVHDLHGVARTNYYDSSWRILRSVNHNAKETSNYNYVNGALTAVQMAAGDRICEQVDFFARPLEVVHYPAPGYAGNAQPQISSYSYDGNGLLTDAATDAFGPSASTVHVERDHWGRVSWIDVQVDSQHTERTTYGYDQTPAASPHNIYPNTITHPDGSVSRLAPYDPSGGGAKDVTIGAKSSDPLTMLQTYDSFGRVLSNARANHPGSQTRNQYDAAGMLIKQGFADLITPNHWIDTTIQYSDSQQGRLVSDPRVHTCYSFDALDQIHVAVEQPVDKSAPKSTCYKYDADGRLEYVVHPEGNISFFEYDAAGRLTTHREGYPANLDQWTSACLDSRGPPIATKIVAAQTTKAQSNAIATAPPIRMLRPTNLDVCAVVTPQWPKDAPPFDPEIQLLDVRSYQSGGFIKSETDGSGVGYTFTTDGFGRPIIATDGDGNQVWRGYDTRDRIIWVAVFGPNQLTYAKPQSLDPKVPLESMVELAYDALDRVTQVTRWHFQSRAPIAGEKLKLVTTYSYDDAHDKVTIVEDDGASTVMQHDGRGRITSVRLADQSQVLASYSQNGHVGDRVKVQQSGPNGLITQQWFYDNQQNLVRVVDDKNIELGSATYDSYGRLVSSLFAQHVRQQWSYDAFDRPLSLTEGPGTSPDQTRSFAWDRNDQLIAVVTGNAAGNSHQTAYALDGLGRRLSVTDPLGRKVARTYYKDSLRLNSIIDNTSQTILSFAYDKAGRMTTLNVAPGTNKGLDATAFRRVYTYTPTGALASATVQAPSGYLTAGAKVTLGYDSLGNRTYESSNGFTPIDVAHVYDLRSRPKTTAIAQHGGSASTTITRTFDPLGRVNSVAINDRAIAAIQYKGIGGSTSIRYGQVQNNQSALVQNNVFDHRGQNIGLDVLFNNKVIASEREGLGLDGAVRLRSHQVGSQSAVTDVFEVDDAARLIAEGLSTKQTPSITGDVTNQNVDALVQGAQHWRRYQLDGVADWIKRSSDSGNAGATVDPLDGYSAFGGASIHYDAARDTTAVGGDSFLFDGIGELVSATANGETIQFGYDALGRRVIERSQGKDSLIAWDGIELAGWGSSRTDPNSYDLRIGADDLDSHLAFVERFGSGTVRYLHQRGDGSIIAASTDQGLSEAYTYSGFGETAFYDENGVPASKSAIANRLLYQGQLYDPTLRAYSMRAREYAPAYGRFLSPDPIGLDGGAFNRYAFAEGRPLLFGDPLGLRSSAANAAPQADSTMFGPWNNPTSTPQQAARRRATRAPLTSPKALAQVVQKRADDVTPSIVVTPLTPDEIFERFTPEQQAEYRAIGYAPGDRPNSKVAPYARNAYSQAGKTAQATDAVAPWVFGVAMLVPTAALGASLFPAAGVVVPEALEGEALTGAASPLVEGGGLAAHEAAGGHLLARHVAKTTADLAARLAANPNLKVVSSFLTRAEAEAAVSGLLRTQAARIVAWLAGGGSGTLVLNGLYRGGAVLIRGAADVISSSGITVVLQGLGNGSFYILTGYLTP